ncbi:MAG: hypothetical protein NTY38_21875 [Acidobacteria bacterium]|nr:hypothetical protein [Acidobacteriota bacterium]
MSRVEQIEGQVKSLNADELRAFRDWFARYDADRWDEQIEADARNGKLFSMAERALRDHLNGHSTES